MSLVNSLYVAGTVTHLIDIFLLLFAHVLEPFDIPEAFLLLAETGEGEAYIPLSRQVVEC